MYFSRVFKNLGLNTRDFHSRLHDRRPWHGLDCLLSSSFFWGLGWIWWRLSDWQLGEGDMRELWNRRAIGRDRSMIRPLAANSTVIGRQAISRIFIAFLVDWFYRFSVSGFNGHVQGMGWLFFFFRARFKAGAGNWNNSKSCGWGNDISR